MNIYIVIPVCNEEMKLKKIILQVLTLTKNIITINDASTDSSEKILKQLPVILINNESKLGYSKTLEKGIIKAFSAGADYVITFDADGQHQVSDLKKYISIIENNHPDLVLGSRSFKNRFMEEVFGFYSKARFGFSDPFCGMKAYKKTLFNKYGRLENKYSIATELTFKAIKDGADFIEVPIKSKIRQTQSRFARSYRGNWLEFVAFINILFM